MKGRGLSPDFVTDAGDGAVSDVGWYPLLPWDITTTRNRRFSRNGVYRRASRWHWLCRRATLRAAGVRGE